uniref:Putative alcohol dehydrogenase transcription factor myb/sant-like protein rhodnius neglectus n=2 Tax=Rhodnius TaxID=13248 RepID=A0A4P6DGB3_RHOPR
MAEKKTWPKEEVFSLIEHWQASPGLWNVRYKSYKNRIKKQRAIKRIAIKFNTTENEISRKLHNLRTQFNQEIRRINSKKSGDEADDTAQSTWQFFDAMKFLAYGGAHRGNLKKTKEIGNKVANLNKSANSSDDEDDKFPHKKKARKVIKYDEIQEYDSFTIGSVPGMQKQANEFQIFGEFVASELNNLKSKELQRKLKLAIQRQIIKYSELDGIQFSTNEVQTEFCSYPEVIFGECKMEAEFE